MRPSRPVGRVTVGDWPTGVAWTWAQQHGGPWPATTTQRRPRWAPPRSTGRAAGHLPGRRRREPGPTAPGGNPWRLPRRVDGGAPWSRHGDLPSTGLLVADFSRVLAGPLPRRCWPTSAPGGQGRAARRRRRHAPLGSAVDRQDSSSYYECANRYKESVTLDLTGRTTSGSPGSWPARADVVVENFPTGTLARRGLDYDSVRGDQPRRRVLLDHGFRQRRRGADLAGYDFLVQAMGGLMSITGEPRRAHQGRRRARRRAHRQGRHDRDPRGAGTP